LRIADLANPLEGTFNLSQCGDAGKYLSISTGYRKGKKPENENKVEIWFVPRFLVEKEINGSTSHFKEIFPENWPVTSPVGIIWTSGDWDNMGWYDYFLNQDLEHIRNDNLYEKWHVAGARSGGRLGGMFSLAEELCRQGVSSARLVRSVAGAGFVAGDFKLVF